MTSLLQTEVLKEFACTGAECEDTCCKIWSMQLDKQTHEKYQQEAPELLDAVEEATEADFIMRKDESATCVKFESGLCGIHREYGDKFLGDACHFYPRATRLIGELPIMTATMSCPEVTKQVLALDNPVARREIEVDRLPNSIKNYLPEGMSQEDALQLHSAFLDAAADNSFSAERNYLRIASVSRFLDRIETPTWPQAVNVYFKTAEGMLPPPQADINDPFNVLHALCGIIVASKKPVSERLQKTVSDMEGALGVRLDWDNVLITAADDSLARYNKVRALWENEAADFSGPILSKWLQMQMSINLYPLAGLGNTLEERITIIGVRMATVKLALMCAYANDKRALSNDEVVRIIQTLSRILDHLGDPGFSLQIYNETGWNQLPRMCGLLA